MEVLNADRAGAFIRLSVFGVEQTVT